MARPTTTKELLAALAARGIRVDSSGKHHKALCPGGMVVFSKTPSDHRSLKNTIALLRRYGVDLG